MVYLVFLVLEANEVFLLVGVLVDIHMDEVAVPVLDDATDAAVVDFQSLLVGAVDVGDEDAQLMRNACAQHG